MKAPETKWPVDVAALGTFSKAWWRELKESLAERGVDLDALGTFSEAQWREIKESLAERGVDLDAETVDEPFGPARGTFSEAQWREIKESLAERGVDLDAETVDELYGPREWWGWDHYTPSQAPLRNVLQDVAYGAAIACEIKPKTPKQHAEEVREEVAEFQKVLALVNSIHVARGLPTFDELDARIERRKTLQAAIAQEIAERRAYLDKLEAAGSHSAQNARTARNDYWQILAKLWLKVTGSAGPKRRQRLRRFLLACTPPDLFPDMTAQDLEQKLDSLISNFFKFR